MPERTGRVNEAEAAASEWLRPTLSTPIPLMCGVCGAPSLGRSDEKSMPLLGPPTAPMEFHFGSARPPHPLEA